MTSDITWGPVDWSRPIEAVHEDGRVVRAVIDWSRSPDCDGDYWLTLSGYVGSYCVGTDDDLISPIDEGWRIRNVAQPAADAPTAPIPSEVGPEASPTANSIFLGIAHGDQEHRDCLLEALNAIFNGTPIPEPRGKGTQNVKKSAEVYSEEAVSGMAELVRDMAASTDGLHNFLKNEHYTKARAIVALLPEPVDADWEQAKHLTAEMFPDAAPQNEHALWKMAHAGLRLGRALAAEGL